MNRSAFLLLAALLMIFCPEFARAENVIGQDQVISTPVFTVLQVEGEGAQYAQAFNYFFTIEILSGLIAAYCSLVIRIFRM